MVLDIGRSYGGSLLTSGGSFPPRAQARGRECRLCAGSAGCVPAVYRLCAVQGAVKRPHAAGSAAGCRRRLLLSGCCSLSWYSVTSRRPAPAARDPGLGDATLSDPRLAPLVPPLAEQAEEEHEPKRLGVAKGVPRKGVWTSVNMGV